MIATQNVLGAKAQELTVTLALQVTGLLILNRTVSVSITMLVKPHNIVNIVIPDNV